jgi:hypothetical protein
MRPAVPARLREGLGGRANLDFPSKRSHPVLELDPGNDSAEWRRRLGPRSVPAVHRSRSGRPNRRPDADMSWRARTRRLGSGNRSGSRLPAPITAMTAWRFPIVLPPLCPKGLGARCAGWGFPSAIVPRPRKRSEKGHSAGAAFQWDDAKV